MGTGSPSSGPSERRGQQSSRRRTSGGDKEEPALGRKRGGLWGWSSPIVEDSAPGGDVYLSFQQKGLPQVMAMGH